MRAGVGGISERCIPPQAPDAAGFDEVMVVQYKSRFQFLHMALLDPHYWPLMCALPPMPWLQCA